MKLSSLVKSFGETDTNPIFALFYHSAGSYYEYRNVPSRNYSNLTAYF